MALNGTPGEQHCGGQPAGFSDYLCSQNVCRIGRAQQQRKRAIKGSHSIR